MVGADKTTELWRPPKIELLVTISAADIDKSGCDLLQPDLHNGGLLFRLPPKRFISNQFFFIIN